MRDFQIFLSHSTHDRKWCEWLKASAATIGVEVYLAEHDHRAGEDLAGKIERAIDASKAVVVLLSKNGAGAPYVHQEIGYARRAKKFIIPLVEPGVEPRELAMLQGLEFIPFDFQEPRIGREQLNRELKKLLDQQTAKERQRETMAVVGLAVIALLVIAADSNGGMAPPTS
jgi:hypothetical protein